MTSPLLHPVPGPSPDGYVRLSEGALAALALDHVASGLDASLLAELHDSAIDARLAGYTEWHRPAHTGVAYVTVGWDWYLDRATGTFVIAGSDVRSNVMVVDATGADIGMFRTAAALAARLASIDWPAAVASALLGHNDAYHAGPTLQ
ncbi:TPA: DUF4902 domain-containing protein [Burkholderia aenigmatica]|uniref:DUF4902 domain-containing protein n=1 Tax=Burkholderia sp. AU45251 TaxID=3059204 RepID=UPI0026527676|nr:DUF4902 domain-containing protein [Burkholderia sp. AU45251]HDR9480984.1 DUF4902 domain-containing protein [Burkholderia aenigmatica]MDN7514401.1 DUF4902 domain-containing protein [Burkholderia sp. AU45251]HDR9517494.1 DUF4902 domain-containing protein [Burkholderia aenigmatica]HDR9520625.1 DUF4902 domain-containing protein [Burkholderia aenigmatica]HDR9594361.1 DUF4902 domain-containing protein [Burkholderia aenigmatica]